MSNSVTPDPSAAKAALGASHIGAEMFRLDRSRHADDLRNETWRSFRGVSANLLFKVAAFACGFLFQILYARSLGADGLGRIGLAMSAVTLVTVFCNLSMDTAITRFAPKFRGTPEFSLRLGAYLGFMLRVTLPLAALGAGTVLFGTQTLSHWVSPKSDVRFELAMMAPLIILVVWSSQEGGVMRANEDFVRYSFANDFLPRVLQGFAFLGLYFFTRQPALSFLLAYGLGTLIPLLVKIVLVRRVLGVRTVVPSSKLGGTEAREMLAFSLKSVFYTLLVTSMAQTTRLLLGAFGVTEGVGIYMVIESLSVVLAFIRDSMGTVLTPQLARLHAQGQTEVMISLYRRLSRWSLLACLPYTMVMVCNGQAVLSLYGEAFTHGTDALIVLMWAQFLVVVMGLNGNVLYMTGSENVLVFAQVLCLALVLGFGVVLIPKYGLAGGAFAMGLGMVLMNLFLLGWTYRRFRALQFDARAWRTLIACLAVGLAVWGWPARFALRPIALDLMVKVTGAYVLCAVAVAAVDRREEDKEILRRCLAWVNRRVLERVRH